MTRDAFVEGVLHGRDRRLRTHLLRFGLLLLSWLHRIGLALYLAPYRLGVRQRYRLRPRYGGPIPVVAIGNITSGGTGKTPMAVLVAGRGSKRGYRTVVLSRGYGGKGLSLPRIVSDGQKIRMKPERSGDEPALLARLLPGVPVLVGKDRRRSGRLAVRRFAPDVLILDDALQFWQLHRDVDIVLLDAAQPFDNGYLLPRGLLREPPSHLRRAHIIVLTRADRVPPLVLDATRERVQRLAPQAEVFTATHAPLGWVRAGDGVLLPTGALDGREVNAFAGIADCGAFVRSVESLGARTVALRDFGDHHAYTKEEIAELADLSCDAAVTTEKDLVKVGPRWPDHADTPSLYALRIGIQIDDPERFWQVLGDALTAAQRPSRFRSPRRNRK